MNKAKKLFAGLSASGAAYFAPLLVFAQEVDTSEIGPYVDSLISFFNGVLVPLILAVAFVVFIWGIFKFFIFGASDEGARESGKQLMIWGIVGFVVIISIVGIVSLLGNAAGLNDASLQDDIFDVSIPDTNS